MSLPAGERRKLRTIERAQATADPGLAARFSMFSQLSRQEEMPHTERLDARAIRRRKRAERALIAYLISGLDVLLRAALSCSVSKQVTTVSGRLIGSMRPSRGPADRPCAAHQGPPPRGTDPWSVSQMIASSRNRTPSWPRKDSMKGNYHLADMYLFI